MTQQTAGGRPLPSQERRDTPPSDFAPIGWVTIREAHEQTAVPVSTLRYWARQGHVASRLDLTGTSPRRVVALDEVLARVQRRGPGSLGRMTTTPRPPSPPLPGPRDQRVPDGAMLVPIDAWNKMLNQLGNLHEAGRQLAEARERAAKAETEALFLRERLAELRSEISREAQPPVETDVSRPFLLGVYERWRRLRR